MHYFNWKETVSKANIPQDKLQELCRLVREEFPRDDMMYELHLLRIGMAICEGCVRLKEVIPTKKAA